MAQVPSPSPLAVIRDKERALAQEIRAAEEHANATLAAARARADTLKQQAETEGMREADALYQNGLTHAKEQAAAISAEGEAHARALHTSGLARIGQAVDHIVQFVLPRAEKG